MQQSTRAGNSGGAGVGPTRVWWGRRGRGRGREGRGGGEAATGKNCGRRLGFVEEGDENICRPVGLLSLMPAHGPHRADVFRVVLGRHYALRKAPNTAQWCARAGLGPKSSCWVRARVRQKNHTLGRPMGLLLFGHL
jgi:hypothetical protein